MMNNAKSNLFIIYYIFFGLLTLEDSEAKKYNWNPISLSDGLLTLEDSEAKKYNWQVLSVVDGDTIKVYIPNIPEELRTSVRVKGIDTPEKTPRAKCSQENARGYEATFYTMNLIDGSKEVIFTNISWDKYGGRILADVYIDGESLAEKLIKAELAREYHGEKKKGWCN